MNIGNITSNNMNLNTSGKDMQIELYEKEIDRLNNIINETRRILGQYAHYSTPTKEQNAKNEAIVDEAYIQLHGNVAKELKEDNNG